MEGPAASWADRMEDLDAVVVSPGQWSSWLGGSVP